jgi:elongation factor P--beta-lysine ligase
LAWVSLLNWYKFNCHYHSTTNAVAKLLANAVYCIAT